MSESTTVSDTNEATASVGTSDENTVIESEVQEEGEASLDVTEEPQALLGESNGNTLASISRDKIWIKVVSIGGSWAYDGEFHSGEGCHVFAYYTNEEGNDELYYYKELKPEETGTLPNGDTITPVTTVQVKDITGSDGTKDAISELKLDNADQYKDVIIGEGSLYVSKRNIKVVVQDVRAAYDGKAHSATDGMAPYFYTENMPDGESVYAITFDGEKAEIGDYPGLLTAKDVKIKDNDGNDTTNNYNVNCIPGCLSIYWGGAQDYITITPSNVTAQYDGNAHAAGKATAVDKWGNDVKIEYSVDNMNWTDDPSTITATNVSDSKTVYICATSTAYENSYVYARESLNITSAPIEKYGAELITTNVRVRYDGQVHSAGEATVKDPYNNPMIIEYRRCGINGEEPWTTDPSTITATNVEDTFDTWIEVQAHSANGNYYGYLTNNRVGFQIKKANLEPEDVTISKNDVSQVYDGKAHAAGSVTATDKYGNPLKVEYSLTGIYDEWTDDPTTIIATDVTDSANVMLRITGDNYNTILQDTEKLEITPADINDYVSLTVTDVRTQYDGKAHSAGIATAVDVNGNPLKIEYSADGENWTTDPTVITALNPADSMNIQLRVSAENGNYSGYVNGTEKLTILEADKKDEGKKDKDGDKDSGNKEDSGEKSDGNGKDTNKATDPKKENTYSKINPGANAAGNTTTNAATSTNALSHKSDAVSTGDNTQVAGFATLAAIAGAVMLVLIRRKRRG